MKNTENKGDLADRFTKHLFTKCPDKDIALKCLNGLIDFLNIERVSSYAKRQGISVQAVYQYYETFEIDGVKFVADNE